MTIKVFTLPQSLPSREGRKERIRYGTTIYLRSLSSSPAGDAREGRKRRASFFYFIKKLAKDTERLGAGDLVFVVHDKQGDAGEAERLPFPPGFVEP